VIAGEDDLDAPDRTTDQPRGDKATEARLGSGVELAPVRSSPFRTVNPPIPLGREKLGADDSAATRAQLIREIETLPEDDLQPRAILKVKNRLSADAKLVEDAFAAWVALQSPLPEALTTDEPASAPVDPTPPQPPSASIVTAKTLRPRGRPKKVKAAAEQPTAKPTNVDHPSTSTPLQADAAPAKIEKSELTISEPRRHRDKAHLKFVASQPCLVYGRSPADAHHLRSLSPERSDARSATNSPYLCAERITGTTTALATRRPGGLVRRSIPWRSRGSFGFRRGESNEGDSNLLPSCAPSRQRLKAYNEKGGCAGVFNRRAG
jgi:hypothetical protein